MARIRHRLAVLAAALLVLVSGSPLCGARAGDGIAFVSGIEDLPLMPGLDESPEGAMVFDTPSGRIVEAYAFGSMSSEAVTEFYAATLPQLGWRREGASVFRREGEILRIDFPAKEENGDGASGTTVHFAVTPVDDDAMHRN